MRITFLLLSVAVGSGCVDAFPPVAALREADLAHVDLERDADVDVGVDALVDLPDAPAPERIGGLLVNEIDYVQPGTDSAEFIELLNTSNQLIELGRVTVDLIDGASGEVYRQLPLGEGELRPLERLVLRSSTGLPAVPDGVAVVMPFEEMSIRNADAGVGDVVRVRIDELVVDVVAYGGESQLGEGVSAPPDPVDATDLSISRCKDGQDKASNVDDFKVTFATPGLRNDCSPIDADH